MRFDHQRHRRQLAAPLNAESTSALLAPVDTAASASSLVFDSSVTSATQVIPPPIVSTSGVSDPSAGLPVPTITTTSSPQLTTSSVTSSSDASASSPSTGSAVATSTASIPIGTVVGACIGSFAILLVIIFLIFLHSRRSKKHVAALQARRNKERRRSKRETWNRLGSISENHGKPLSAGVGMQMKAWKETKDLVPLSPLPFSSQLDEAKEPLPSSSNSSPARGGAGTNLNLPSNNPYLIERKPDFAFTATPSASAALAQIRKPSTTPSPIPPSSSLTPTPTPSTNLRGTTPIPAPTMHLSQFPQFNIPSHPYAASSALSITRSPSPTQPAIAPATFTNVANAYPPFAHSSADSDTYISPQSSINANPSPTNPFIDKYHITPHPSHHPTTTLTEKWGRVDKERNVQQLGQLGSSTLTNEGDNNNPVRGRGRHERYNSQTMESLIAALDLGTEAGRPHPYAHAPSGSDSDLYPESEDSPHPNPNPFFNRSMQGDLDVVPTSHNHTTDAFNPDPNSNEGDDEEQEGEPVIRFSTTSYLNPTNRESVLSDNSSLYPGGLSALGSRFHTSPAMNRASDGRSSDQFDLDLGEEASPSAFPMPPR